MKEEMELHNESVEMTVGRKSHFVLHDLNEVRRL